MARVREIRERVARGGTAGIHTAGGTGQAYGRVADRLAPRVRRPPGHGKDGLRPFHAVNAAKQGVPVCVYSLEMSREQLIFRMLGQIADVEPSKITKGTATEEEMRALEEASRQLKELPICINQRSDIQIDEIRCDISLRRRQGKCSLAIIDYLQLVNRDDKGQTPNEAISNITRKAKITAMDEEIPIVLLCQLNRNCETRGTYSFRHQLSDLRDSALSSRTPIRWPSSAASPW